MTIKTQLQYNKARPTEEQIRGARLVRLLLLLICGSTLLLSGCRFTSPSVEEQEVLAQKGAFAGGAPAWSSMSNIGRSKNELIPTEYGTRSINDSTDRTFSASRNERFEQRAKLDELMKEEDTGAIEDVRDSSPIARITALCPSAEQPVTEAITTTDRDARIQKYRRLTRSCPNSADLWLWLGRDYKDAGRASEARQALEQAAYLDPNNAEVKQLLSEVGTE